MGETFESITSRRSVRRFTTEDVSEQLLDEVLEAARWTPSWANTHSSRSMAQA